MNYILTTENLTKIYGQKKAANNINIHIREGSIYGLIGRNGAGKTTVMRMISGLSKPTGGSYQMHGEHRFGVGVLIESPGIYPNMSAEENLRLKCIAMGCYKKDYVQQLLSIVGLSDTGKKHAGSFSLGMRQRLGIALALVGDPKMIVLDEPINGLDPQGIVEVRQTLEKLRQEKGIAIMISSHILDELGKLADSYGIIHEGELLDEFSIGELSTRCGQHAVVNAPDTNRALEVLHNAGFEQIEVDPDGKIRIEGAIDRTCEINRMLIGSGVDVKEIYVKNISLEDYYLSVTGGYNNG